MRDTSVFLSVISESSVANPYAIFADKSAPPAKAFTVSSTDHTKEERGSAELITYHSCVRSIPGQPSWAKLK